MRIALIVSSAEPGRDGVGDYARAFAEELLGMGHHVYLLAIYDRQIASFEEKEQPSGKHSIQTARFPESQPWDAKIAHLARLLDGFQPDWVSLQFVPYGFHPKGLCFGLVRRLRPLVRGRKLHLMFHELWIGDSLGAPFKHRLVGVVQRHLITSLVRRLVPDVIHTSNPTYIGMLKQQGIGARLLPLFGGIEVQVGDFRHEVEQLFQQRGINLSVPERSAFWVGAIFGTIFSEWDPSTFFDELGASAEREGKTVVIVGIGRFGERGDRGWADMVQTYGGRFRFALFGAQSACTVSQILQNVDFGLATTPWRLLGKSSTAAAMVDHGLPVVVTRDDWRLRAAIPIEFNYSPLLVRFEKGMTVRFGEILAQKRAPESLRTTIVKQFIDALTKK